MAVLRMDKHMITALLSESKKLINQIYLRLTERLYRKELSKMPSAACTHKCQQLIQQLERKPYFAAALPALSLKIQELQQTLENNGVVSHIARKLAIKNVLAHLHDVMRAAQPLVEAEIMNRINTGLITNPDQARKSAAGNIFQQMVAYILAQNVIENNITKNVIVTTSTKSIIDDYAAIQVGDDIQTPDSDVIVYSTDDNTPIMNLSCKTSCRERAGQTYKWKLLCDLATCNCDHKYQNPDCPSTRYGLSYSPEKKILICFVTSDFYEELTNPQIAAMFNFFDYSYVAKSISPNPNILTLDNIIDSINNEF